MSFSSIFSAGRTWPLIALVSAVTAFAAMSSIAGAAPNTMATVFEDVAPGSGDAIDFSGTDVPHAFVNFNQDDETGDLRIVTKLHKIGVGGAEYVIWLVCGTGDHLGCGYTQIGTITLNDQGNGNSDEIIVAKCEAEALLAANSGAGHIDIAKGLGDASNGWYVADGIQFDSAIGPACS